MRAIFLMLVLSLSLLLSGCNTLRGLGEDVQVVGGHVGDTAAKVGPKIGETAEKVGQAVGRGVEKVGQTLQGTGDNSAGDKVDRPER